MVFTNNVLSSSVRKEQFTVELNTNGTDKTVVVKSVDVNKNKVILTLDGNISNLYSGDMFTVTVSPILNDGLNYILTSVDGQVLVNPEIKCPFGSAKEIKEIYQEKIIENITGGSGDLISTGGGITDWMDTTTVSGAAVEEALQLLELAGVSVPAKGDGARPFLNSIQGCLKEDTPDDKEAFQKTLEDVINAVKELQQQLEDVVSLGDSTTKAASTPLSVTIKNNVKVNSESASGLTVTITVSNYYYTKTWTISGVKIEEGENQGTYVVTGGTLKADDIIVNISDGE